MPDPHAPSPAPLAEHLFPCDTCGGDLRFAPASGQLSCDHCGNQQVIEGSTGQNLHPMAELDLEKGLAADLPAGEMEETRATSCANCAAEVAFTGGKHATQCPFCATPVVVDTGTYRQIKPRGVLPFGLDQETARSAMKDWLGGLWFAPNGLQQYARKGRQMQGIYVPYWTYDAQTSSRYRGERGTIYYVNRTVMRGGKRVQKKVTKIRWRPASGRVSRFFDDVLILASTSLPKRFTDALQPWDLSALEPYRPEYLAGFRAEAYHVSLEDGFREARAYMDRIIERDVKFDIGGDSQRIHGIVTDTSDLTFKHILLPVWLAAYKYRGKTYRFVVNGRTGRVQGERPYSTIKITFAVLAGLIVAGLIGYGVAVNQ